MKDLSPAGCSSTTAITDLIGESLHDVTKKPAPQAPC